MGNGGPLLIRRLSKVNPPQPPGPIAGQKPRGLYHELFKSETPAIEIPYFRKKQGPTEFQGRKPSGHRIR